MSHNDDYEISLVQIWEVIKKNFVIFLAILIVFGTIAFAGSKFLMEKKYSATATLIIVKDNDNAVSQTFTYSDVQLSQKLVSTYSQIMLSEAISDTVIANLDLGNKYGIDSGIYKKIVDITNANNTEVMEVSVTTNDPHLSADIANEVVEVFQEKIYDIMNVDNVTILNKAKVPTAPSGPNAKINTAIGVLVGMVVCFAIIIIKLLTDTKVKTEEELKAIFDYPIIGLIPDFLNSNGGKKKVYGSK